MNIPKAELEEWLILLEPSQGIQVREMITTFGEEEAAKVWLYELSNHRYFAGTDEGESFYTRFRQEFRKFICGDKGYEKERKELSGEAPVLKNMLVATISAAIGAKLGIAAAILAPAVVIMLYVVGKMGIQAYCNE